MRFSLKSLFASESDFNNWCWNTLTTFFESLANMENSSQLQSQFQSYVFSPLYRQFKNSTTKYQMSTRGVESFKEQFASTLEDVSFDFFQFVVANLSFFSENQSIKGQSLISNVTSANEPINAIVNYSKKDVGLASGTTAQSLNTLIFNGNTSWYKAFQQFYTPQRKGELIDRFRWLFTSVYSAQYSYGGEISEVVEPLDMADGDMIIEGGADYLLTKVIIEKPVTLIPENIKKGVNIGGVIGTLEGDGNMNNYRYYLINPITDTDRFSYDLKDSFNDFKTFALDTLPINKYYMLKIDFTQEILLSNPGEPIYLSTSFNVPFMVLSSGVNISNLTAENGIVIQAPTGDNINVIFFIRYNNGDIELYCELYQGNTNITSGFFEILSTGFFKFTAEEINAEQSY